MQAIERLSGAKRTNPKPLPSPQPGPQSEFLRATADIVIYGGAAGGGKALALDTPLPTPGGWTTMGAVQAGDVLLDEQGAPCRVVRATGVMLGNPCYRVRFNDGEEIVADADHLWVTLTECERQAGYRRTDDFRSRRREGRASRSKGKRPDVAKWNSARTYETMAPPAGEVRTTKEIAETLTVRRRLNHSVAVAGALRLPEQDLPINPYLLGVWLGDGTTREGVLCIHEQEIADHVAATGAELVSWLSDPFMYRVQGLTMALRRLGVLENKHIPATYLRASYEQRLALLQGLMDTDGCVVGNGQCEYTTISKPLANDVQELLASLGVKVTIQTGRAMLHGKDCGPKYRLKFVAGFAAFKLERKAARQKTGGFRPTTQRRYIVAVEPVPSVPVRCIAVDSPSHCYLAGRAMVPTHNTWALLREPLRHRDVAGFGAVIFRRTYPQIVLQGGMWDESELMYPPAGGDPLKGRMLWRWPSGAKVSFAHMNLEADKLNYQGAQIAMIGWDQLEHFSESMFFYMLSRNRSTCGVKPYIRATCNPDADSWLATFLAWWIDQDTGFPIPERAGVERWFVRIGEQIMWADDPGELRTVQAEPKSVTFIPAKVTDNAILMSKDPAYVANLMALSPVDRGRLLEGNWRIKAEAGKVFHRGWFEIVQAAPVSGEDARFFDFAATEKKQRGHDPDFTAGVKMRAAGGQFFVVDCIAEQVGPAQGDLLFVNTCLADALEARAAGRSYRVRWEQEPGSAGVKETHRLVVMLREAFAPYNLPCDAAGVPSQGDKLTRAKSLASTAQVGDVKVLLAPWTEGWLRHMHGQPDLPHDDIMDASTGVFNELAGLLKPRAGAWGRR